MLYPHCLGMLHYIFKLCSSGTTLKGGTINYFYSPPHAQILFLFINILIYYFIRIPLSSAFVMRSTACLPVCFACLCAMPEWSGTCGPLLTSFETFCLNVSVTEAVGIADFESHLFFFYFPSSFYCDINRFDAISRPMPNKIYIFFSTIFL